MLVYFSSEFARKHGILESIVIEVLKKLIEHNKINYQYFFLDSYYAEINSQVYTHYFSFVNQSEVLYAIENLKKARVIDTLTIKEGEREIYLYRLL